MNRRVLFVDDESAVLQGIQRNLRKDFEVHGEDDPHKALACIREQEPFAVIVSDMRMPGMNGVEFLYQARKLSPTSVRLMLTGNADMSTAIGAVNRGDVFKFLTKPCDMTLLRNVVELSVRQFDLVNAEKSILEETVRGSVTALSEILAIAHPAAFGRVERLRKLAQTVAERLDDADSWELDTAVLLSQIGCVGTPSEILEKLCLGQELDEREYAEYCRHPALGADLIRKIPRLEGIADVIRYQLKNYDGSGYPSDALQGEQIPLSARVLRIVLAYDALFSRMNSASDALQSLLQRRSHFDQRVLHALAESLGDSVTATSSVVPAMLECGMIIEQDVVTDDDAVLLVCRGQEVTPAVRQHLQNFHASERLSRPILVTHVAHRVR